MKKTLSIILVSTIFAGCAHQTKGPEEKTSARPIIEQKAVQKEIPYCIPLPSSPQTPFLTSNVIPDSGVQMIAPPDAMPREYAEIPARARTLPKERYHRVSHKKKGKKTPTFTKQKNNKTPQKVVSKKKTAVAKPQKAKKKR